jgi:hypothetical protein
MHAAALVEAKHMRDVLHNATVASVRRTHAALGEVAQASSHPLLQLATRCIWRAYTGLLESTLDRRLHRLTAVYAALPFARVGADSELVAASVLGSAVALSEDTAPRELSVRERSAVRCAVSDIAAAYLAQCAVHTPEELAASREAMQQAVFAAAPKGRMQPDVDAACAPLRRAFALDDGDVAGSLRAVVVACATFRASLQPPRPAPTGLACAVAALCALPGFSQPLADVIRSVDVSAAVARVHAAPAAATHAVDAAAGDEAVYAAAGAAWRAGVAGLQRLILDALVLLHFTGNGACARHALRCVLLHAADACVSYAS